jgi:putative drug exporter of the RND superfamily
VLLASVAAYPVLAKELSAPNYAVDGSQSVQVERMLDEPRLGATGSEHDSIVFYSTRLRASDRAYRATVRRVLNVVHRQSGVRGVSDPYAAVRHGAGGARKGAPISADGHAVVAPLGLGGDPRTRFVHAVALQDGIARAAHGRVHAWLTGFSAIARDLAQVEKHDSERAEAIGVPVALVVLLVALGAVAAAVVPLLIAGAGLVLTFGVIAGLAAVLQIDAFLLSVVTMLGVGIGIDYSLFIVARFREELACSPVDPRRERRRIQHAVGVALATSGRTVLYSGAIVMLALTSLLVIPAPIFREFVIGTFTSVLCALAAALTLLPALLAQLGERVNSGSLPVRMRPAEVQPAGLQRPSFWERWARVMMRRPVPVALAVAVPLIVMATPVHSLRYGFNAGLAALRDTPSGKAVQVLNRSFSPGLAGPVEVLLTGPNDKAPAAAEARATRYVVRVLHTDKRIAGVTARRYPGGVLLTAVPAVAADSRQASALVRRIRGNVAAEVHARTGLRTLVGGWTAQAVDATDQTVAKMPLVLAVTLGLALLFLLLVFRSVLLPLKAIAMNLIATGASLGLVVLVFQQGHGERLLGFTSSGFLQAFLPLCMFVVLFGLSMDYEVFLIRRMQERWDQTADNQAAVVSGIAHTARPISAAAAIMVAVFGSFITADILELKQFAFALAVAIAIDATLVRLMLVPALMRLFGERNWWLPRQLASVLPRLDLEGEG